MEKVEVIFGAKNVLRELKRGNLKKVIYAKYIPQELVEELKYYARLCKVEIEEFDGNSMELGRHFKRPHPAMMVGIRK